MKLVSSMLFLCFAVFGLAGCWHLAVGPAAPRPNVMLAQDKTPAALVLDPGIADTFVIPGTGSVNSVPVRGWRGTLEAGFRSAFPPGSPTGRKLELIEAELTFAPAAVGFGGTAAVRANIRFKARVLDASGKEIGVLAGNAAAREANVSASEAGMTDNASKAVEALYEVLATELLAKL
jgi:hypothetical protein